MFKARYFAALVGALALNFAIPSAVIAQVQNPGAQIGGGAITFGHVVTMGPGTGQIQDGGAAPATQSSGANPTATAGPAAVNGAASTFMRSDAAPAVQLGTNLAKGLVEGDGATITCVAGVCSQVTATPIGANPSATATTAPVNGAATTYMRSDAAPAVAATTFGGQSVGPGGTAGVQGNGAKIQLSTGTTTTGHCAEYDLNGNTIDNGTPCGGAAGANPTATASDTAVNGVATTFMRSDGAPAVQKASNTQFGLVEGDNVTVTCSSGVCGQKATSFVNSLAAIVALSATATYFDGPSTAQGTSGTWLATGQVTLNDTTGAAEFVCKLWDGTTVINSSYGRSGAVSAGVEVALSGIISSPAGNIKISCRDITTTTGQILPNISGNSKDSTLTVLRIQ